MTERPLISSFTASSLIHLLLLTLAAFLIQAKPLKPITVPIELINIPRIDVPKVENKAPVVAPEPKRIEKVEKKIEKIAPPKLIQRTEIPKAEPTAPPRATELPPSPIPSAVGPEKGSVASKGPPGEAAGAEAGAGALFGGGDVAVVPGAGVAGGGGGRANAGLGRGEKGEGSGGGGSNEGITQTARPMGGYQVRPRYPESARRIHFQGTTILRVRVLENGSVGDIQVAKSAGHRDLDVSAMDAVKQWRFEPALRGKDPVAVWATVPVNFELH